MTRSPAKLPDVKIPRDIRLRYERFLDHFKGFENVDAVRGIFGPRTKAVLRALKVEFFSSKWGYMGVSDEDGHLVVSTHYLWSGRLRLSGRGAGGVGSRCYRSLTVSCTDFSNAVSWACRVLGGRSVAPGTPMSRNR